MLRAAAALDVRLRAPAPSAFIASLVSSAEDQQRRSAAEMHPAGCPPSQKKRPPPLARGRAVVIEGLDGTGKSTLAASLAGALGARLARCPPESLRSIRPIFDGIGCEAVERAFYTAGNYIAAAEMDAAAEVDAEEGNGKADGVAFVVRSVPRLRSACIAPCDI